MRKKTAVLVRPHELRGAAVLLIMALDNPSAESYLAAFNGAYEALEGCAGEDVVIGLIATPCSTKECARFAARHIKAAREASVKAEPTAEQQATQLPADNEATASHQTKEVSPTDVEVPTIEVPREGYEEAKRLLMLMFQSSYSASDAARLLILLGMASGLEIEPIA